jgi:hypothetical protein
VPWGIDDEESGTGGGFWMNARTMDRS